MVSTDQSYVWTETEWKLGDGYGKLKLHREFHVVAYDFGVKLNILRMLAERGCKVTVVPAQTPAARGAGIATRRRLPVQRPWRPRSLATTPSPLHSELVATGMPTFGICLGHQIMALAAGAKTFKMSHGHHGANHPVKDLDTGRVSITSQNHGFAVDIDSLPANLRATHVSLFDGTLQGLARTDQPAFSFQGHPEASPGPHDIGYLLSNRLQRPADGHGPGEEIMPKRTDIKSILIIGAGPIIIGQACEFDYSGVQACKALREEGYKVILINSNPATIMTDPATADVTYIEPITWQTVEKIIAKERPDAILPTMGGQTALNCALDLWHHGVLDKYKVELIGATPEAIDKAEDRLKFKDAMTKIGLGSARSGIAHSMDEAWAVQKEMGFPTVIRPSFTLGGTGGGIAYNPEEFETICKRGLEASPTNELLIEESLLGWKEYEMEVVRDKADNCIIVCSIENLDPMGVHTGDSITVAPAQTLTDKEYQIMRNA